MQTISHNSAYSNRNTFNSDTFNFEASTHSHSSGHRNAQPHNTAHASQRVLFRKSDGTHWLKVVWNPSGTLQGFIEQSGQAPKTISLKGIPSHLSPEHEERAKAFLENTAFKFTDYTVEFLPNLKGGMESGEEEEIITGNKRESSDSDSSKDTEGPPSKIAKPSEEKKQETPESSELEGTNILAQTFNSETIPEYPYSLNNIDNIKALLGSTKSLADTIGTVQSNFNSLKESLDANPSDTQRIMNFRTEDNSPTLLKSIVDLKRSTGHLIGSLSNIIRITKFNKLIDVVQNNKKFVGAIHSNDEFLATGCLIAPKLFLTTGHYSIHQKSLIDKIEIEFLSNLIETTYFNEFGDMRMYKDKEDLEKSESSDSEDSKDSNSVKIGAQLRCGGFSPEYDFAIFELDDQPSHLKNLGPEHRPYAKFDLKKPTAPVNSNPAALIHCSEEIGEGASGAPLFTSDGGIWGIHNSTHNYNFDGCTIDMVLWWLFKHNDIFKSIYNDIFSLHHSEIHLPKGPRENPSTEEPKEEISKYLPKDPKDFRDYQERYRTFCSRHSYDGKGGKNNQNKSKRNSKKNQSKAEVPPPPPQQITKESLRLKDYSLTTLYTKAQEKGLLDNAYQETINEIINKEAKDREKIIDACKSILDTLAKNLQTTDEAKKQTSKKAHIKLTFTHKPTNFSCYLEISNHMDNENTKVKVNKDAADVIEQALKALLETKYTLTIHP